MFLQNDGSLRILWLFLDCLCQSNSFKWLFICNAMLIVLKQGKRFLAFKQTSHIVKENIFVQIFGLNRIEGFEVS